jgi:hypothetical protein
MKLGAKPILALTCVTDAATNCGDEGYVTITYGTYETASMGTHYVTRVRVRYPIQYVSDTRRHTFSKENPLKWCIRVSVSVYPASIGYGYVTLFGVSV